MTPTLRRKRPFCLASQQHPGRPSIPFHTDKHPDTDYCISYNKKDGTRQWIGQNRLLAIRQPVTIQSLPETSNASFNDIMKLCRISHDNVVKPDSFYYSDKVLYIVYEFLYLDIFDLFPLKDLHVACVMKQILCGLHHLKQLKLFFRVNNIQVNEDGVVKIVIDWNQDVFSVESSIYKANEEYLVVYLQELMVVMAQSCVFLPQEASSFLIGSVLPDMDHPFISDASGPGALRKHVISAIRKKLLGGGIEP